MSRLPPEFASLPKPAIVEEIDAEAIRLSKIAKLNQLFQERELPYTVSGSAHDPATIQIEGAAHDEARLRQRINEAARAYLLAYAASGDLDQVGHFHGLPRMPGEEDDRYAYRIALKNADRNSAGSEPHYQLLAMSADLRVRRTVVYTIGRAPTIRVAVQSTDNDGVADQPLIDAVKAAIDQPGNKVKNDTILVEPATRTVVAVSAEVWLLPDAPISTLATIETALRDAWAADGHLGRDMTVSWLARNLHQAGVQRVEAILPAANVVAPFNQFLALGAVTLAFKGRAY